MTPSEFEALWKTKLNKIPRDACEYELPDETLDFLESAGLPESAAPGAHFGLLDRDLVNSPREQYDLADEDDYNDAVDCPLIGIIADGDPVVIDADGALWCLRRADNLEPTFLNSSVAHLAQCLLRYRDHLDLQSSNAPPDNSSNLLADWRSIDPPSLASDAFWPQYLPRP